MAPSSATRRAKSSSCSALRPLHEHVTSDGLLNEFKMLWHLRHRFPLHFLVFKMTASHLPHEANVEQYFSRAGAISDPNMDPEYLGKLVTVGVNKSRFKPPVRQRTLRMFLTQV